MPIPHWFELLAVPERRILAWATACASDDCRAAPYTPCLHEGAEYRGTDRNGDQAAMCAFHQSRWMDAMVLNILDRLAILSADVSPPDDLTPRGQAELESCLRTGYSEAVFKPWS